MPLELYQSHPVKHLMIVHKHEQKPTLSEALTYRSFKKDPCSAVVIHTSCNIRIEVYGIYGLPTPRRSLLSLLSLSRAQGARRGLVLPARRTSPNQDLSFAPVKVHLINNERRRIIVPRPNKALPSRSRAIFGAVPRPPPRCLTRFHKSKHPPRSGFNERPKQ